ncbi:MAG: DUF3106 domain-containing protein [Deltaproteobacteria bacterium]|nr:DUF3106 domain-containing protein [Deltaproteobacteria bacterium]
MKRERKLKNSIFKNIAAALGLCIFLTAPISGWALDDGDNWRNRSPKERENIRRNYRRWQNLPQEDKQHLREEWDRWQTLPKERRDMLKNRYEDLRRRRSQE